MVTWTPGKSATREIITVSAAQRSAPFSVTPSAVASIMTAARSTARWPILAFSVDLLTPSTAQLSPSARGRVSTVHGLGSGLMERSARREAPAVAATAILPARKGIVSVTVRRLPRLRGRRKRTFPVAISALCAVARMERVMPAVIMFPTPPDMVAFLMRLSMVPVEVATARRLPLKRRCQLRMMRG